MAQTLGDLCNNYTFMIKFRSTISAGAILHIIDDVGSYILVFKTDKSTQLLVLLYLKLTKGSAYAVYIAGILTDDIIHGLHLKGIYTPTAKYSKIIIS